MGAKETSVVDQPSTKNDIRSMIEHQLEKALIGWKEELGDKKFRKRIKKAGKVFGKKLKNPAPKPKTPAKSKSPTENNKQAAQ